jgi:WD40 repeat protein
LIPDGRTLASCDFDFSNPSSVALWDVADGPGRASWDVDAGGLHRVCFSPGGTRGPVRSLAFRADGKTLAVAGEDGKIVLWDRLAL